MMIENIHSPKYATADHAIIDVVIEYQDGMTSPFSAMEGDVHGIGASIHAKAVAGEYGAIAAYAAPPFNPAPVKSECQRRIFAVASQNTQMNMMAYVASGLAPTADKNAFKHSLEWVSAMRAASAGLIDDEDVTFADDAHWPACPVDVIELASRF